MKLVYRPLSGFSFKVRLLSQDRSQTYLPTTHTKDGRDNKGRKPVGGATKQLDWLDGRTVLSVVDGPNHRGTLLRTYCDHNTVTPTLLIRQS